MEPRSSGAVRRFRDFVADWTDISVLEASALLTAFARGESVVCPEISLAISSEEAWGAITERADIIADYSLYGTQAEAAAAAKANNASVVSERRAALNQGWAAFGFEARADELAADLSVSVPDALAQLHALRIAHSPGYPTIEQRSQGVPEMGGDATEAPLAGGRNGRAAAMKAAISRAAGTR